MNRALPLLHATRITRCTGLHPSRISPTTFCGFHNTVVTSSDSLGTLNYRLSEIQDQNKRILDELRSIDRDSKDRDYKAERDLEFVKYALSLFAGSTAFLFISIIGPKASS